MKEIFGVGTSYTNAAGACFFFAPICKNAVFINPGQF